MAEGKIGFKVGSIEFTGEGDGKWLSEQLDKVLDKIPQLAKVSPTQAEGSSTGGGTGTSKASGNLAAYLKSKNVGTNQTKKFLATAAWLQDTQDKDPLTTGDVSQVLSDNKQTPLSNASQSLANNVKQGFCGKKGKKHFFVTDEGRADLG
jgi:NADH pyrophosphatase NudC (nudix superfamily)